ncbi:ABC transporter substrate-binding protein [Desulfitobacterium sp. PCE1]|uniref:ABC transporter substrate-binding protein n=1 Tax=Desulfitobacterium sp. PCE1 TaxID=146907 RepID=UPI0003745106|nr:ABC transporter substrate-binding protein [Desulfitobacterium sp. PCE1]
MKKIISLALACIMVLSLAACSAEKVNSADPKSRANNETAEILTIAISKDENSLSPFTYLSSTGLIVNRLVYDTLFTTDLDNEIIPWMVEDDYRVENDFSTYTFTLLEGQKFHDGTVVTSEDVVFSFTYPGTQKSSSLRKICNKIKDIKAVDERTVTINLKSSDINFLRSGLSAMRIISKNQYENAADATLISETIGSGMYKLSEYKVGEYYKLEAVADYFRGTPKVKAINMPIIGDNTAIQQGLLSGQLAAATSNIGVEMVETFNKAQGIEVFSSAGFAPLIMNINNSRAPMDAKEFRTALTYAIDVNGIMKTLYGEYATVGTKGLIRPDLPYSVTGLEYSYSPGKANEILDGAGFDKKNANGIRLTPDGQACSFEILVYSGNTTRIRTAEMIAEQLKAVGIEMKIKVMEMDTVDAFVWPDFDVTKGRNYDFAMWGWGTSIGTNLDFLVSLFSGDLGIGTSNVCGYTNSEFDQIIASEFSTAKTTEELYSALRKLQNVIAEDPGLVNFGYDDSLQACNTTQYSGWKAGKGTNVINIHSFLGK